MLYLYISKSNNPYENLATEDFLVDFANRNKNIYILYFWQNENTVVVGRNQDVFSEVNIDYVKENKIYIARRKTGGGAVFHDKNNLNFSFIVPKNKFDKITSSKIIQNALKDLGIDAQISGRNDILVNNKKISGNAYLNKENVTLHHGTILLDTNFELLEKSLNVGEVKLNKHSVKSIKSRVLNLKNIYQDLTIETLKKSILKEFEKCYSKKHTQFPTKIETTQKDFYSSDEWIFGDKKFVNLDKYTKNFNWGICEIKILKNQNKNHIKIYSDALDTDIIKNAEKFINTQQKPEKITEKKIVEIYEFYNDVLALQ